MDDIQGTLARSLLFRGVPSTLVAGVAGGAEARLLSPHERLMSAGGRNTKLYIVLSGSLSLRAQGTHQVIAHLKTGDCVGESAVLEDEAVEDDIVADESTVVLAFDRALLWSIIDVSPELARNLLKILAGRVGETDVLPGESTRLKRYLDRIATMDPLTGLHNRRWLDEAFGRQLERATRAHQCTSALMIDIDNFKRLNDEYGHLTGDAVLGRVAQTLTRGLRPQDLLARYGGEEFAVLLPGLELGGAFAVGERLRLAVQSSPTDVDGFGVPAITVSIGAAEMREHDRLDDLLTRADIALFRAKDSGKNCCSR